MLLLLKFKNCIFFPRREFARARDIASSIPAPPVPVKSKVQTELMVLQISSRDRGGIITPECEFRKFS